MLILGENGPIKVNFEVEYPVMLDGCYILPEDHLHEIDARNLPDTEYDFIYYILPSAKSIASSKCYHTIVIKEINENGVLLSLETEAFSDWHSISINRHTSTFLPDFLFQSND